jgi:hypothetical protein
VSAEVLREAATAIRRDTFNGQTEDAEFMEAVADWLDRCAAIREDYPSGDAWWVETAALNVARAYLGNPT